LIIGENMLTKFRNLFKSVNSSEEAAEVYMNYVEDKNKQVEEAAYYLWLNGSTDAESNWKDAEKQING
jgi:hypothetical protein